MHEFFHILRKHILFDSIEEEKFDCILKCLKAYIRHYAKNETILADGEKVTASGIVVKGSAHIDKIDIDGNRVILGEILRGQSFGESLAFAEIKTSPLIVSASESCSVIFIPAKNITRNCSSGCEFHAKVRENLVKLLARRSINLHIKNDILSQKTIREKLLAYLCYLIEAQGSKTVKIPFSKEELADYLCVNRSALSRELGNMKKEGIIKYDKNSFTVTGELPGNRLYI